MGKILEAFADENLIINPVTYKGNSEYREAMKIAYKIAETLGGKMNSEEKELFEKFRDAQSDEHHLYAIDRFIYGYRLGALMMVEIFSGSHDFIIGEEDEN